MAETNVKMEDVENGHEAQAPPPATEVKTEIKTENGSAPPEKATKIIEQIEYYFGDINLPRDKFLQDEIKKDEGWVSLETMLKFNRLKQLCDDVEQIANALQDSLLIHVSEDMQKIRRNPEAPLPENSLEYWQEIKNRTVYVKGFPADTQLDDIMEFVKPHGNVQNILMRRLKGERTFKGSVFVTFKDQESAQKFVNSEQAKEFKGQELVKLMQMDYWKKKNEENKAKREASKALKQAKNKETLEEAKKSFHAPIFVKGIVLQIAGVPKEKFEKEKTKEAITAFREFFRPHGEVAYVDYNEAQDKVEIRFKSTEENFASKVWDAVVKAAPEGKVKFEDNELQATILEGEEEQRYWADFTKGSMAKQERMAQSGRGGGRGGRGGSRGGRGGSRGGRGRGGKQGDKPKSDVNQRKHVIFKDSDEEEAAEAPPAKKTKEEPAGENGAVKTEE